MKMRKNKTKAFEFQPFSKKQLKLISWWHKNSPHKDKDMLIANGSIRSGKTIAMIFSFLTFTINNFKHQNFIVAGRSMGSLKRNVIEPMFQILTALGVDYNYKRSENPHIIIGTNTYYLFGASNEASQDYLQGITVASAYADEVALMPLSFVNQMIARCSVEGSKIFMNCNPAGAFHWLKTDFIDRADEKNILVLNFKLDDNLSLSEEIKDRYKRMYKSKIFYKRYIEGLWVNAENTIYDAFDNDVMSVDEIPRCKNYWIGIDYGNQNSTSFILVGQSLDNKCYIIDEYYHSGRESNRQKSPRQYAEDLKAFIIKHSDKQIENVFIDPAATSFILTCYELGISRIAKAFNDVKFGIGLIQSLISEDRFFIHKGCKNLLKEMSTYSWDEKAVDDRPIKKDDNCVDSLRYAIATSQKVWVNNKERLKLIR